MDIVLIDDDKTPTDYYQYALKCAGFAVQPYFSVDDAMEALLLRHAGDGEGPHLLILDVMIPPGRFFAPHDTSEGLKTGLCLHAKLREMWPTLPMIALTHAQFDLSSIENDIFSTVVHKSRCAPMDLVEIVRGILRTKH